MNPVREGTIRYRVMDSFSNPIFIIFIISLAAILLLQENSPTIYVSGLFLLVSGLLLIRDYVLRGNSEIEVENLKAIVDATSELIWISDKTGKLLLISESWHHFTGQDLESLKKDGANAYVHPDDRKRLFQKWDTAIQTTTPISTEFRLRHRSGKWHWMSTRGVPLYKKNGEVRGWLGMTTDVTIEKSGEWQLMQFMINSPFSIAMFDQNICYLYTSRKWNEEYGLGNQDLRGKCHYDLYPDISSEWKEVHQRCLRGETIKNEGEKFVHPNGKISWIQWEVTPWYNAFDEIGGILIFALDISTKIKSEIRAREEAEKGVRMRDELISIAAHELRTPVSALKLQIQILLRQLNKEFDKDKIELFKKSLTKTDEQVNRYIKLVNDLLNVTQATSEELQLKIETFDMKEAIHLASEQSLHQIENANKRINIHAPKSVWGKWDQTKILELLGNIINNSLKYGNGFPVDIYLEENKDKVRIKVQDHGIGISKEDRDRIFKKFERAVSIKDFRGFGIGLYLSKRIVDAHHGKIWVESEVNQGSTFNIELPHSC